MSAVDVPHTPVRVVVAVGARAKVSIIPEGIGVPVVVVMAGKANYMYLGKVSE